MSLDTLMEKIVETQNPTVVGLDPKLEYVPEFIKKDAFDVEGYKADDVGMILDEDYNIAVRTGYHCAPHIHSHLKDERYLGTVRVGISQFTSLEELDKLISALEELG